MCCIYYCQKQRFNVSNSCSLPYADQHNNNWPKVKLSYLNA